MALAADGRQLASGRAPGPLVEMPIDGLEVGRDKKGAVGPYDVPNAFSGKIRSVEIELGR